MRYIKKEWPLLVWCFLVFSFCGWLYELGWELYLGNGFVNKSDTNLFYLPIYGFGGLALILCLKSTMQNKVRVWNISFTPVVVFIATVFIATFVEYISSCLIEDLYGIRLWDYSTTPYNLNGRIALKNSIIFGIMGILGLYGILPAVKSFLSRKGRSFAKISAIVILVILALDALLVYMGYKFI